MLIELYAKRESYDESVSILSNYIVIGNLKELMNETH